MSPREAEKHDGSVVLEPPDRAAITFGNPADHPMQAVRAAVQSFGIRGLRRIGVLAGENADLTDLGLGREGIVPRGDGSDRAGCGRPRPTAVPNLAVEVF